MLMDYAPHMWAEGWDLVKNLRAHCECLAQNSPLWGEVNEMITAFEVGDDERGLVAAHCVTQDPQCPEELRAVLQLACAMLIADEGDLPAARLLASQAVTRGRQTLGACHDVVLELRRWELHWMTFTMMDDIAIKRYRGLVGDAHKTWGEEDPRYWRLRLESAIPLVFNRKMPALIKRMESIVRHMPAHTVEFRDLRANAYLVLAQHYVDFGEMSSAERTYQAFVDWCDTWSGMVHEASAASQVEGAPNTAQREGLVRCQEAAMSPLPGTLPGELPGTLPGELPGEVSEELPGEVPEGLPGEVPGADGTSPRAASSIAQSRDDRENRCGSDNRNGGADVEDEAMTPDEELAHCAKLRMLGMVMLSYVAQEAGDACASRQWAQQAARTMPIGDLEPRMQRIIDVVRGEGALGCGAWGDNETDTWGVRTLAIP